MTKRQKTLYMIILPLVGAFSGIIVTAFALGAGKQHMQDTLIKHEIAIQKMEESIDLGTHRHIEIITSVANLGADIRVLTVSVELLKNKIKSCPED